MKFFIDDCEQRFIAVYHEYISEIYQYVYLRTGFNQVTTEDITQEIFIAVYKGYRRNHSDDRKEGNIQCAH